MAVNKVVYGDISIIDISDSTVAAETLGEGKIAYGADGEKIIGTMQSGIDTSDATATADNIEFGKTAYASGEKIKGTLEHTSTGRAATDVGIYTTGKGVKCLMLKSTEIDKRIIGGDEYFFMYSDFENIGDATAEDVANGKTFTSSAGVKIVGTAVSSGSSISLQTKTVIPSKSSQAVTPDSGYDGLSKVTVNAIPSNYIVPEGTKTITENGTMDVTNYASVNVNVPTSGGSSNNNCEAYLIDVTNPVANFKTTSGTIKAYGYGKGTTSGYTTPQYAFQGDKYLSIASWGSGTTTNLSLTVDSSGKLSGLPSMTSGTLLVTRGI